MKKIKVLLLLIMIVYLGAACTEKEAGKVKISVAGAGMKNLKVEVFTTDMASTDLQQVLLAESRLDSTGNTVLEFELNQAVFAYIKVGDIQTCAFSAPGDVFKIILDSLQNPERIRYEGDQAKVNEYLEKCETARLNREKTNDKYYFQLKPDAFLSLRDSLREDLGKLFSQLEETANIDPELACVLLSQQKMYLTNFVYDYVKSGEASQTEIPESLRTMIRNVPEDSLALEYKMVAYTVAVNNFLESQLYTPLLEEPSKKKSADSIERLMPVLAYDKIQRSEFPGFLKELMAAKNVNRYLSINGITPQLDSIYQKFNKVSKNKDYISSLKKSYNKWLAIGPGKPAPDFSGETPDGKKLSLSDLKGKVVYMDVWATWCGPCKTEFPYTRKIQKDFEGNDSVAFLFVSIDESIPDWHAMLKRDKEFRGVHINQKQHQQPGAIWELYKMTGIPRYILIDGNGKIIQPNASRPSSGKVTGEIIEILNQKK